MAEDVLSFKISPEMDSTQLLKQFEDVFKQASNILEKNISDAKLNPQVTPPTVPPTEDKSGGGESGGGFMSGLGNVFKSMGTILKSSMGILKTISMAALKIFAGVSIVAALIAVFEPVVKLVTIGFKMLAEFLRPISDMLLVMFMPILSMLRPILQVFRVLMAPFRQAAMLGMAAAQQLMAEGGAQIAAGNFDVGQALIAEGLKGAMASASLLLSGFIKVALAPVAEMFGLGARFESAMASWQSSAIAGVYTVIQANEFVQQLGDSINNVSAETLVATFDFIRERIKTLEDELGGFTIENFFTNLDTVQTDLNYLLNPFVEYIQSGGTMDSALVEFLDRMDDAGVSVESAGLMAFEAAKGFDRVTEAMKAMNLQQSMAMVTGELKSIEGEEKGFFGKMWEGIKGGAQKMGENWDWTNLIPVYGSVKQGMDFLGGYVDSVRLVNEANENLEKRKLETVMKYSDLIAKADEEGWLHQFSLIQKYWSKSIIPDAFDAGFLHMLDLTNQSFGDNGKINVAFQTGLTQVEKSTNNFSQAMKTIADSIVEIAKKAADAARRAEADAERARRAAKNAARAG